MDDQFGGCPECGGHDGYRNIGRAHFFFCDEHQIVWPVGSNLFSSWRGEAGAVWRANVEYLEDYELYNKDGRVGRFGDHVSLPARADELEEELRRRSDQVEAEQLEREISGNLTPEEEELADLREERLRRQALGDLRPGDRVRKPDGTTATVATTPVYYERAEGYPFTGWGVAIEPDEDPQISLARVERGLGPLTELALLERLTLISGRPE